MQWINVGAAVIHAALLLVVVTDYRQIFQPSPRTRKSARFNILYNTIALIFNTWAVAWGLL